MTVLLVDPCTYNKNVPGLSQAILTLYPALNNAGYDVKILNNFTEKELINLLDNTDVTFVGVTTTASKSLLNALKISEIAKGFEYPVFWGGPYATLLPEQALQNDHVDGVVIGEGEKTIVDLAETITKSYPLKKVSGIAFKEKGRIIKTSPRELIKNLDDLPFPAFELIENFPENRLFEKNKFAYIESSRGCPYRCSFCYKQYGVTYRTKTPKRILEEIKILNELGIFNITFIDDNFLTQRKRVITLCKKIIAEKIDISWTTRGARVDEVNRELLTLMKKSGCVSIAFGVESGSQRILNLIKKDITVDQVITAFDLCHDTDIKTYAALMTDIPNEKNEDILLTLKLIKRIQPASCFVSFYSPIPKTDMYAYVIKHGFVEPKSTTEWSKTNVFYKICALSNIHPIRLKIIACYIHLNYNYVSPLVRMFTTNGIIKTIKLSLQYLKMHNPSQ